MQRAMKTLFVEDKHLVPRRRSDLGVSAKRLRSRDGERCRKEAVEYA